MYIFYICVLVYNLGYIFNMSIHICVRCVYVYIVEQRSEVQLIRNNLESRRFN